MPCKDALIKKVLTLAPDLTVEQALKDMKKGKVNFAPVLDDEGNFLGVFSYSRLLQDTLPVSVAVGADTAKANIRIPSAPGMAKRLTRTLGSRVGDLMDRQVRTVNPDTALETAIRFIRDAGEPVAVIETQSWRFLGLVTDESLIDALGKAG
jgi:CBS domain-containing protein